MVASVDAVIAPSISEWFGSVHTEAVAMKKPLITTNVASIPEVVGNNALFIQPCCVKQIVEAVKDIQKIKFWESNIKKFNWDKTVEEIEKLYN